MSSSSGATLALWIIFGIIGLVVGVFVLVIVAWMGGVFVVPFIDAITNAGTGPASWDFAGTAMTIGLKWALPLLGVGLFVWFLMIAVMYDAYYGRY